MIMEIECNKGGPQKEYDQLSGLFDSKSCRMYAEIMVERESTNAAGLF